MSKHEALTPYQQGLWDDKLDVVRTANANNSRELGHVQSKIAQIRYTVRWQQAGWGALVVVCSLISLWIFSWAGFGGFLLWALFLIPVPAGLIHGLGAGKEYALEMNKLLLQERELALRPVPAVGGPEWREIADGRKVAPLQTTSWTSRNLHRTQVDTDQVRDEVASAAYNCGDQDAHEEIAREMQRQMRRLTDG